jgi:hypothetical protein
MIIQLPDTDITFHEVLGGSDCDLADLLDIHSELFPEYAYYQPYMRERAALPPNARSGIIEHWWLVRVKGEAAGARFFDYVPHRDCGLGLAVGVRRAYRSNTFGSYQRLSEILLRVTLDHLLTDAHTVGRPAPFGMVSEIEAYVLSRCLEYGYVELPVHYQEPSFIQDPLLALSVPEAREMTFRPITLGCLPTDPNRFDPTDPVMLTNFVKALLIDHYCLPENHPILCQALDSIESREKP